MKRDLWRGARAGLLGGIFAIGCPGPRTPAEYTDDPESSVEAKAGTPCQRAAKRLADLKCPESAPDFAQRCQELVDQKIPICPSRLAKIKACAETATVCR